MQTVSEEAPHVTPHITPPSLVETSAEVELAAPKQRQSRTWVKRYMPDEVNKVLRDYDAGLNAEAIHAKHGVSKATLYRWIAQYQDQRTVENDPACMRMKIATLEKTVLGLLTRLAEVEDEPHREVDHVAS